MKPNAFIIEDELEVAELFCHAMALIGYQPVLLTDPEKAMARLQNENPAVVLLDMKFGSSFSGPALLRWIRSEARLEGLPVIVISGYPRHLEQVAEVADFTLIKPVDIRQLMGLALRLQHGKGLAVDVPGNSLLEPDVFMERLSFNLITARRKSDHLFPVILLTVRPESLPVTDENSGIQTSTLQIDIANRLIRRTRSADSCTRLGENEYAVMLYAVHEPGDADIVADRLVRALEEPFVIDGNLYRLQANAGVAMSDPDAPDPAVMIARAKAALDQAVRTNRKISTSTAVDE